MKNLMYFFVFSVLFLSACANEETSELIEDQSFSAREANGGVLIGIPDLGVYHHYCITPEGPNPDAPGGGCFDTGNSIDFCCPSGLGCDIGGEVEVIGPYTIDWNQAMASKYLTSQGLEDMLVVHVSVEEGTVIYEILATTVDYESYGPVSDVFLVNSTKDGDVKLAGVVAEALGYSTISVIKGKYDFKSSGDKEDLLRGTIKMKATYE